MRRILIIALAVVAMATIGASAASAAPARYECRIGYVCFYMQPNGLDKICETKVSGPLDCDNIWAESYYNRGTVQPGQDHAYFHLGLSGFTGWGCIHQGSKGNFPTAFKINYINWWGECKDPTWEG